MFKRFSCFLLGTCIVLSSFSINSFSMDSEEPFSKEQQISSTIGSSMVDDMIVGKVAREILMVDEQNQSLIPEYKRIINEGLPKIKLTSSQKDVLILGAGISGLLTGKLLRDAGYNVTILEANANRVGGRIKTFHSEPGKKPPFKDPDLYAEAGAMRIPTTHPLVNELIKKLGLKTQPFYNGDVSKDGSSKETLNNTWISVNGITVRGKYYNSGVLSEDDRDLKFPIPKQFHGQTAKKLLDDALVVPNLLIKHSEIDKQVDGWKTILREYNNDSMRDYLQRIYNDEAVLQYIGTMQNLSSRYFLSFIHSFVDTFYINSETKYISIEGGNWKLPNALEKDLEKNIVMNARAVDIYWDNKKSVHGKRPGVFVRTQAETNLSGEEGFIGRSLDREFTADYLVISVPFSSLRYVNVNPELSYEKRRAIIDLHYDSATKVLLEFSERFWEFDELEWAQRLPGSEYRGHNSIGGNSITDSPNRFIYYPSHCSCSKDSKGGVILASYTWSDDANRWDSIPSGHRVDYALKSLTDIYGEGIRRFFTGHNQTQSWMQNYYAFGEAAVFSPGQALSVHPYVQSSEGHGHIYFAGEHTSMKHAWIEGALESAIRVALEISENNS